MLALCFLAFKFSWCARAHVFLSLSSFSRIAGYVAQTLDFATGNASLEAQLAMIQRTLDYMVDREAHLQMEMDKKLKKLKHARALVIRSAAERINTSAVKPHDGLSTSSKQRAWADTLSFIKSNVPSDAIPDVLKYCLQNLDLDPKQFLTFLPRKVHQEVQHQFALNFKARLNAIAPIARVELQWSKAAWNRFNELMYKTFDVKRQKFMLRNFGVGDAIVVIQPPSASRVCADVDEGAKVMGLHGDAVAAVADPIAVLSAAFKTTVEMREKLGLPVDLTETQDVAFGYDGGGAGIDGHGDAKHISVFGLSLPGLALGAHNQGTDDFHPISAGNLDDSHTSMPKQLGQETIDKIRGLVSSCSMTFRGVLLKLRFFLKADGKAQNAVGPNSTNGHACGCHRCRQRRTDWGTKTGYVLRTKEENAQLAHLECAVGKTCPGCKRAITPAMVTAAKADYQNDAKRQAHASSHFGIYPSLDHLLDIAPENCTFDMLHLKINICCAMMKSVLSGGLTEDQAGKVYSHLSDLGIIFNVVGRTVEQVCTREKKKKA